MRFSITLTQLLTGGVGLLLAGCGTRSASQVTPPYAAPTATLLPANIQSAISTQYSGPSESMRWGPVQVTITVKKGRINDISASAPQDTMRSQVINSQALPALQREVLRTQSAHIDLVSGATLTSQAFILSLQGALVQAHIK